MHNKQTPCIMANTMHNSKLHVQQQTEYTSIKSSHKSKLYAQLQFPCTLANCSKQQPLQQQTKCSSKCLTQQQTIGTILHSLHNITHQQTVHNSSLRNCNTHGIIANSWHNTNMPSQQQTLCTIASFIHDSKLLEQQKMMYTITNCAQNQTLCTITIALHNIRLLAQQQTLGTIANSMHNKLMAQHQTLAQLQTPDTILTSGYLHLDNNCSVAISIS